MAWRRIGDKPLSEKCFPDPLTHICATRERWVNWYSVNGVIMTYVSIKYDIINLALDALTHWTDDVNILLRHVISVDHSGKISTEARIYLFVIRLPDHWALVQLLIEIMLTEWGIFKNVLYVEMLRRQTHKLQRNARDDHLLNRQGQGLFNKWCHVGRVIKWTRFITRSALSVM